MTIHSTLNASIWESELQDDPDKSFLLDGIANGFNIVDDNVNPLPADCENYLSATDPSVKSVVEKQIRLEFENGNYEIVNKRPVIVSALGAIPKQNSDEVRLIHDCSRPIGTSLNNLASKYSVKYQTVEEAVNLSSPGCYYVKIDLKSAYRSVNIHPDNYNLTGLKWVFEGDDHPTYFIDKRLPFGARKSPAIFHRLTQAVRRMMSRKGFPNIVVYLDDFLIVEQTKERCLTAMNILITLLRSLGFSINWAKVTDPCNNLVFLGIELNSINNTLTLPETKLKETLSLLEWFRGRARASKKQLQRLAGKLNWACRVIRGGRSYLRRVLDLLNSIKLPFQKAKLGHEFCADIEWWLKFMTMFNGVNMQKMGGTHTVHIDACNKAAGIAFNGDWLYVNWELDWPEAASLHINYKEVLSFVLAARRWGHLWSNTSVPVLTDSECAKYILRKGSTKNPLVMKYLRELFWISAIYNFEFYPDFICGQDNLLPDTISRLHENGKFTMLESLLYQYFNTSIFPGNLRYHMSYKSLSFLILQITAWVYPKLYWIGT